MFGHSPKVILLVGQTKDKKISHMVRFENYEEDCNEILEKLNYSKTIQNLNRNPIYDRTSKFKSRRILLKSIFYRRLDD